MRQIFFATLAAAGFVLSGAAASAATFAGYTEVGSDFFNGDATLDYEPSLGGSIFDIGGLVNIFLDPGFGSGSNLSLVDGSFNPILDGTLSDFMVGTDSGSMDDTLSILFGLTTGPYNFAIATFTGDLDNLGLDDFLTAGAFVDGNLRIVGAQFVQQPPSGVVPLPATLPMILAGLGGIALVARRRKAA